MARSTAADGPDDDASFLALVDQVLEGADWRILFHADLPADHAPAVDRDEVARLVAGAADHLVDCSAGRGLRHHRIAVRPRREELGARDLAASAQDIFERR